MASRRGIEEREPHATTFEFGGEQFAVLSQCAGADAHSNLTVAERAVAKLVMDGHSNADIARARRASVYTVGNQIASIFRKVGVTSRFELIARMSGRGPKK